MAFIELVREDDPGDAATTLDVERQRLGYVPNYARLFALRPDVYAAWRQLVGAVAGNLDRRRYELATVAAARRLRSTYCMLAHGAILRNEFHDAETVRSLATDHASGQLDDVDRAIVDFADRVVADAAAISSAEVEQLRRLGLSDVEILDVALAAAVRCFFSKTLDALGVQADEELGRIEPELREALVVGRPIAADADGAG